MRAKASEVYNNTIPLLQWAIVVTVNRTESRFAKIYCDGSKRERLHLFISDELIGVIFTNKKRNGSNCRNASCVENKLGKTSTY
jgi:hypothetical protein